MTLFEDKMPKSELFALLFSGTFIIAGLMTFNTSSIASIVVVMGLLAVVAVLIENLFSLNSADCQYEQRILEPYQKTFEAIGLLRYYPEEFIKIKRIGKLPPNTAYRVGVLASPYPDLTGFTIKTIDPSH